jgi:hypothetical protein
MNLQFLNSFNIGLFLSIIIIIIVLFIIFIKIVLKNKKLIFLFFKQYYVIYVGLNIYLRKVLMSLLVSGLLIKFFGKSNHFFFDFLKDYIPFLNFLTDKDSYILSRLCQALVLTFVITGLGKFYKKRYEARKESIKTDRLLFLRMEIRDLFMGNTRKKQLVTFLLYLSIQAKVLLYIFWPNNLYVHFNNVHTIIILSLIFCFFFNLIKLKNIEFYRAYDRCFPERGLLALNLKSSDQSFIIYKFEQIWAHLAKGKGIPKHIETLFHGKGKGSTERLIKGLVKECERGAKSELEKKHFKAKLEALEALNIKEQQERVNLILNRFSVNEVCVMAGILVSVGSGAAASYFSNETLKLNKENSDWAKYKEKTESLVKELEFKARLQEQESENKFLLKKLEFKDLELRFKDSELRFKDSELRSAHTLASIEEEKRKNNYWWGR